MTERNWTTIGAPYTSGKDRARIEREIGRLTWHEAEEGLSMPFSPGSAIQEAIRQLRLPKVSRVAWNGALNYPDGLDTATYGLYGIEANYKDGPVQVYLLDLETDVVPLRSDFDRKLVTT